MRLGPGRHQIGLLQNNAARACIYTHMHGITRKQFTMENERYQLLTKLGFGALTCNSLLAIYRSRGDPRSVGFVIVSYAGIVLLFHFLREYERAGRTDGGRVRIAVWALTTLLTAMFASRVAPLMPPFVAVVVWLMAATTAAGGFWAFFLSR